MKKEIYLAILYDYYGELLTDKQKNYFVNYYFDNLSLSEIADNLKVSRNAIHKQLKVIEIKLNEYESVLKLYDKEQKIKRIINEINDENIKSELENILKQ